MVAQGDQQGVELEIAFRPAWRKQPGPKQGVVPLGLAQGVVEIVEVVPAAQAGEVGAHQVERLAHVQGVHDHQQRNVGADRALGGGRNQLRTRFVTTAQQQQRAGQVCATGRVGGFHVPAAAEFRLREFEAAQAEQGVAAPVHQVHVVGVGRTCARVAVDDLLVPALGDVEGEVEVQDEAQDALRQPVSGIDRQRLLRQLTRDLARFGRGGGQGYAVLRTDGEHRRAHGQGVGEARVQFHRLPEQVRDLHQLHPGEIQPARPQVERVGVEVAGAVRHRRRRAHAHVQVAVDGLDDGGGDFVLDVEQVVGGERAVVGFRPQVLVALGVDQLGGDAQAVAGAADAAFQHVPHFQRVGDRGDAQGLLLAELERRGARRHRQAVHADQHVEDFFTDAVGEPGLVAVGRQVGERQYRYRVRRGKGFGVSSDFRTWRARLPGQDRGGNRSRPVLRPQPVGGNQRYHRHHAGQDQLVHAPAGRVGDGRLGHPLPVPLQAVGRQFEHPRKHQRRDKTQGQQNHQRLQHPVRRLEDRQQGFGDLHDQPGPDQVEARHADDVAATQLGQQFHESLSPGRGIAGR